MNKENTPHFDRRGFVAGALAMGFAAAPASALAGIVKPPRVDKRLHLLNVHTGEEIRATFWRRGAWDTPAIEELDYFMRDWRQSAVKPIDWRLYMLLSEIDRRAGFAGPLRLVSGYRSPETNEMLRRRYDGVAKGSFHTRGQAADIWIYGVGLSRLRRIAASIGAGGVGYYPESGFLHVDVGPVRRW